MVIWYGEGVTAVGLPGEDARSIFSVGIEERGGRGF